MPDPRIKPGICGATITGPSGKKMVCIDLPHLSGTPSSFSMRRFGIENHTNNHAYITDDRE